MAEQEVRAEENAAWIREQVADRGLTAELEAKAVKIFDEALSWNAAYWVAWMDGRDHRGMTGNRLNEYAHAYADITEEETPPTPLAAFWEEWQHDVLLVDQTGTWRRAYSC